ncbi:TVP38/TMEM64 family protein [Lolliginicoccus suaedae]|uniref:TVP38/TMEM64 family protein n=1 Tax=Lolliginicoccus suaedae TaxID=2605429 RepID=UPI001F21D1BA|nr:TVP38/TMEM64 family protein [Lolliginicoccus suaedae]
MNEPARRTTLIKLAMLALLLGVATIIALTVDVPGPEEIRDRVAAAGAIGVIIFVLAYAGLSLTPAPASVFSIASGVLFGLVGGALVVFSAAMIAATVAYGISRYLGAEAVVRYGGDRAARAVAFLRERGLVSVLLARLIPLFPFWLVNYAGGLGGIAFRHYTIGTAIGIIPGVLSYVALGAFGTDPLSWPFLAAIAAFLLLTLVGGYSARRMRSSKPMLVEEAGHA